MLAGGQHDDGVRAVVLDGAGERGLCAGGDVIALYHSARAGGAEARKFWFDEYRLIALDRELPQAVCRLMDGIVMGGGVGVGAHGNVRVVTDTTKMAMPEVGIGFIPDVGATYPLSRAPGGLGLYAALTGAPFSGADAIALGFADHFVPHDGLAAFVADIVDNDVDTALSRHAVEPPSSQLLAQRRWIDECFAGDTVADIVAALRGHDAGPANDAANVIAGRSPIALAVTLKSLRRAAELDTLEDVLRQEYRASCASAAVTRLRRGHPRPAGGQGPQAEVVAREPGRGHRRRRRRLLRPRRSRSHVLGETNDRKNLRNHPRRA